MCFMSPEQMQQVGMQASSVLPILLGRLMQGAPGGPQGALPPGQAPGVPMIPPASPMGAMTAMPPGAPPPGMMPPGAGPPGAPTSFPLPPPPGPVPLRSNPPMPPVVPHR